ncbi:MAG: hypothetical protein QM519_09755 [Bacteroidia bacterium]|nr:hypothetical protein [Bacteroidia bacterium]
MANPKATRPAGLNVYTALMAAAALALLAGAVIIAMRNQETSGSYMLGL